MPTIREAKLDLEEKLSIIIHDSLPQTKGYTLSIEILEKDRRKRSDASLESWKPGYGGEIRIRFGNPTAMPDSEADGFEPQTDYNARSSPSATASHRGQLIRALRAAEQRPGFDFVALKWFRDLFLPAQGLRWTEDPKEIDRQLRGATEDRVLLTYKVPSPKSPAFPVTAIRLNREHSEVVASLGIVTGNAWGFAPVEIRGEPLSTTVLRDRR